MTAPVSSAIPEVRRGKIYRSVYDRRVDNRRAEAAANLKRAHIADDMLVFDDPEGRESALTDGVFVVRIPETVEVAAGDAFARQFHLGPSYVPYGRFRDLRADQFVDPLLGFHQRVDQIEQFLLERRFWASHYPAEIRALGEALTSLSQKILRSVLAYVGLPERDWRVATGGCSDAEGSYHLTFNHYRPSAQGVGLSSHKDDGFVTILRTTSAGLEINRQGEWEFVRPDPSFFVVNFGLSMEILTSACAKPVAAIMHRVTHQTSDRVSFGHFTSSYCQPESEHGIYRYLPAEGLQRLCGSRELIDANDYEIYKGTDAPEEQRP